MGRALQGVARRGTVKRTAKRKWNDKAGKKNSGQKNALLRKSRKRAVKRLFSFLKTLLYGGSLFDPDHDVSFTIVMPVISVVSALGVKGRLAFAVVIACDGSHEGNFIPFGFRSLKPPCFCLRIKKSARMPIDR